jgi:5-methylthioadenosine/S-adenosylhomocysteine deaminase
MRRLVLRKHGLFQGLLFCVVLLLAGVRGVMAQGAPEPMLVVRNAVILTMAPGRREPVKGYLVVGQDGRLATVAAGEPPVGLKARQVWDAGGHWVLPGFISAHSHLWQSAFRGLAGDQTLTGWIKAVYDDHAVKAAPQDFYWFTLDGALDHLQHGITGVYNFNYGASRTAGQGGAVEDGIDANEFRAERDSGIRFVHGTDPGWAVAKQDAGGRLLSVMVNGDVAFNNTYQQAVLEKALMDEFHLGNETHYLEAPEDQYEELDKFRWLEDSGMLGRGLIFGHFIHTNPYILAESAKRGVGMSWNPLSNGRLASGVADIPAYLKAGIRVGMGVDGEASADLADPFENMRTGLYAVRAKYEDARVLSPYDVLRLHTMGSADVLGVGDKLGSLEAGKMADFVVVDPTRFGPVTDTYASLVFIADERDLERVYVGGELMVKDGVLVKQDFAKVKGEVGKRVAGLK